MSKLGYGNMKIREVRGGAVEEVILQFNDTSYMKEIADVVEQPIHHFDGEYQSRGGICIYGEGFLFETRFDAEKAAKNIVEQVYRKKE